MWRTLRQLITLSLLGLALSGCDERPKPQATSAAPANLPGQVAQAAKGPVEVDLDAISTRGELRILTLSNESQSGDPTTQQSVALLEEFAHSLGLTTRTIDVPGYPDLLRGLARGEGDLIASVTPPTPSSALPLAYSLPLQHHDLVLVARSGSDTISEPSALAGLRLGLPQGSGYWPLANELFTLQPLLRLVTQPGDTSVADNLQQLLDHRVDLVLLDSTLLEQQEGQAEQFSVVYTFDEPLASVITARQSSPALLRAFNRYLTERRLTHDHHETAFGDLAAIRERGSLRVLTRNNTANYFLWRGRQMGFEFELAERFAKREKLDLEVVVVPNHAALLPMLLAGKGDIAVGFLSEDPAFSDVGVRYSEPYHYATAMLVGDKAAKPMETLADLVGHTVTVRPSSRAWRTLLPLSAEYRFTLAPAPEEMEDEQLLAAVAAGELEFTVVDNHLLKQQRHLRDDIQGLMPIGEMAEHRWAVRSDAPGLLAELDKFHTKTYRSTFYNLLVGKYFTNPGRIIAYASKRIDGETQGAFSNYDDQVKRLAEEFDFDWRLINAQIFQESRFDPEAQSDAGAKGLMQIMPDTARLVGVRNLDDPVESIRGGIKYLAWLRDKFESELTIEDRTWFALASYNAGLGHVLDARKLAAEQGLDPNRWFGNVEQAMLLLSERKYSRKARHGYVRGSEPVNYVREIRSRYRAYTLLTAWDHPSNG